MALQLRKRPVRAAEPAPASDNPRALVTGGSGYFGSVLVRHITRSGQACRVFDLRDSLDRPGGTELLLGDIRDRDAVRAACEGVDVVYHSVAQVPLAKNRQLFREINIGGTEVLLEAALQTGVTKVISVSSSAVYGAPKKNPVTEATPPSPGEPYGRTKLAAEKVCRSYVRNGLDVTIVRPRTIIGPGRLGIFQLLFEWIFRGVDVPVLGGGRNVYQFIHADDLAEGCLLASRRPGADVYNFGAEEFGRMSDVLESLCAHAGTGSRVRSLPKRPAEWAMRLTGGLRLSPLGAYHTLMYGRSFFFDVTKARSSLDWRPKYSNEQMFQQSYDWYVANRSSILAGEGESHHRSAVGARALRVLEWLWG